MTIQIEKNIPAPTKPVRRSEALPFADLQVGDSFVVELSGHASWGFIYNAIQEAQKVHDIKLTTRLLESGKRRIWRVA